MRTDSRTSCERLLLATAALFGSSVRGSALRSTGEFGSFQRCFCLVSSMATDSSCSSRPRFLGSYSDPILFTQTTCEAILRQLLEVDFADLDLHAV